MFKRGLALLAVLAVTPAHAALIEYSFTAFVNGNSSNEMRFPAPLEAFGLERQPWVTGGFLFDDAAPRTSYSEQLITSGLSPQLPYLRTTSTYDMSNLRFWVNVGDHVLSATGTSLSIQDFESGVPIFDKWELNMLGDGQEVNGYTVSGMSIRLWDGAGRPLTSSELQVPDPHGWGGFNFVYPFSIRFTNGFGFGFQDLSFAPVTSVPEPATLSLLGVGALGAIVTRRRRRIPAQN